MPQLGADPQPWHCESLAPVSDTDFGTAKAWAPGCSAALCHVMNFRLFIVRLSVCVLFGVIFSSDEW